MRVIVTDADIGNNAMIYYSLVQSSTFGMFSINSLTGEIMVQSSALDREVRDTSFIQVNKKEAFCSCLTI